MISIQPPGILEQTFFPCLAIDSNKAAHATPNGIVVGACEWCGNVERVFAYGDFPKGLTVSAEKGADLGLVMNRGL